MVGNITCIVFDLGGVLIDWNPAYVYRNKFVTEAALTYFLNHICTPEWNEEQDAGRSFEEATRWLTAKFPQYTNEIAAYYTEWQAMLGGSISPTVHILETLKKSNQCRLLALTNWSAESFPIALERFAFLSHFEGILVSGEEGIKKPDPAIFNLLELRYDLDKLATLFIDDNIRNIEAASKLGYVTFHYTSSTELTNFLIKAGFGPF